MQRGALRCSVFLLALLFFSGCRDSPEPRRIRLRPSGDVKGEVRRVLTPRQPPKNALRVAVAGVLSPRVAYKHYDDLLAYLARKIDRPVLRIQRSTYAETNELIAAGDADVAFVCTLAYVIGHQDFGMELLAAPVVQGKQVYYSYIIVPSGTDARSVGDLRDGVFAFTDPLSNSGRLAALDLFRRRKIDPATFFARTFYTYSHDNSIRAVADAFVDGAAVDSLVFESLAATDPTLTRRVRIIWKSPAYAIPPVVNRPGLDPALKARIRQALLGMHRDPAGRRVLEALGIERFAPIQDEAYESVRQMLERVGGVP